MAAEMGRSFGAAAYGGEGWQPRRRRHRQEIGDLWTACGLDCEWSPLRAVLLHEPGDELVPPSGDVNSALQLAPLDIGKARAEYAEMVARYRAAGVDVHLVAPDGPVLPNQMFCADLFAMTSEGAILARPASEQRAGEERHVAARLAALGIPILKTLTGNAVFEGADLMWIDADTAVIARGLRTNQAAIDQLRGLMAELGVELIAVDLPAGTMHLMGVFRIVDRDLAVCWPYRVPHALISVLEERGYRCVYVPDEFHAERGLAMNLVTLAPRRILMAEGCDQTRALYERNGIDCLTTPVTELSKAAGAVGCLTGVLRRDSRS